MKTVEITTLEELNNVAKDILTSVASSSSAQVLGLSGDLGAGKTAFTKELARLLGVAESITSPTFVIMRSYAIPHHPFFKTLVHIDAYRIASDDEMRVLKFADLLKDPTNLICIEWPEHIQKILPPDVYTVAITINPDGMRTISYGR